MQGETRYKILVWTIVVLAVLNIATITTVFYSRYKATQNLQMTSPGRKISERSSMKFSGRYFRDNLGLNEQQMGRFSQFNPAFRMQVQNLNFELADKRHQMLVEMTAPKFDTIRLNQLSDSIGFLHARLKKLTYGYYLDFREICDRQQQQKLEKLFSEMFAAETQPGPGRQGGINGRQHGRRFKN
jgi:Spy/CpxP family protein refolding chaperone